MSILVGSVLIWLGSSPAGPRPSMKADISTLHKPGTLILRRHRI
jgi:hypothetical protein